MSKKTWRITLLCLLILALVLGLSACQLGKEMQNTAHTFSQLPDRLVQGLIDMLGGLKGIGTALSDSIRNIVRGMTGH